jgi:hypothetical protein
VTNKVKLDSNHIRLWCSVILQAVADLEDGYKNQHIDYLIKKREVRIKERRKLSREDYLKDHKARMKQAYEDYVTKLTELIEAGDIDGAKNLKYEDLDFTKGAEEWFDSMDDHPRTYRWICDMCDLDADKIRELVRTIGGRKHLLQNSIKLKKSQKELIEELEKETNEYVEEGEEDNYYG